MARNANTVATARTMNQAPTPSRTMASIRNRIERTPPKTKPHPKCRRLSCEVWLMEFAEQKIEDEFE
jgi:hypothetical protein